MNPDNQTIRDYYILPVIDINTHRLRLRERNGAGLDTYRFESLDTLFAAARNVTVTQHAA